MHYKLYFEYKIYIWNSINKDQLTRMIFTFKKQNYPKDYKNFNLKNLDTLF
jgi:hypothetical protein